MLTIMHFLNCTLCSSSYTWGNLSFQNLPSNVTAPMKTSLSIPPSLVELVSLTATTLVKTSANSLLQ